MQAAGMEPEALKNRPVLTQWTAPAYRAFLILSDTRPVGFSGMGHIPLSEVVAYCQLYDIKDFEEKERLVYLIRALDTHYMEWAAEKRNQKQPAESGVGGSNMAPQRPRGRLSRRG